MITEFLITSYGGTTTRLDLEADIPLPVTYNIMDIREPEAQVAHWSKTLRFPGTKTNNILFQHIFEIGIDGGWNPNKKADIYVLQDTIEVLRGVLQLKKITRSEQLDLIYYECNAFGGTDDLFTKVNNSRLTDLDFSVYNHAYSKANQLASWTAAVGTGYVYPMIDYAGRSPDKQTWEVSEFFPALFAKEYWDKIFTYAGKTYTSTFLTSDFFKRLIVPFNKEQYQFNDADIEAREFRASRITSVFSVTSPGTGTALFNQDNSGTDYDPSNVYNTGNGKWTIPAGQSGWYSIKFSGTIQVLLDGGGGSCTILNTGNVYAHVNIKVNGVIKKTGTTPNPLASPTSGTYADGTISGSSPYTVILDSIFLAVGDEITIEVKASNTGGAGHMVTAPDAILIQVLTASYFVNGFQNILTEDVSVGVNSCIPADIQMKDFVVSIIDMFRLYMQADPDIPNNYIIEPRDDWYTSTVINWADKLDRKQGLEIIPMAELQGKRYIYRYKEDKDIYNDLYQKTYLLDGKPRTYGDKIIDVDNDFVTNDVITQPIFSPTPIADDANTHDRIIPRMFSYAGDPPVAKQIGTNIRILYWAGLIDFSGLSWNHVSVTIPSVTIKTQYPYAGHLDEPYEPTLDLSFGMPIECFYDIKRLLYTDNNLYNKYHRRAIDEIIDPDARLVTGYFRLKPTDIFQLSFRPLYYFEGELYRLNKIIDYDLSVEKLTKCEFIKAKDTGAYVPTSQIVIGGPTVFGEDGGIVPRPPPPPIDNYDNLHNPQEHVVVGTNNNAPRSAVGITIVGDDNVVGEFASNIHITGSNNLVYGGLSNVTLLHCNDLTIEDSDVLYINNCLIDACPVTVGESPIVLFNNYADVGNSDGTTETDLYSYTIPINRLAVDGESIEADYSVNVKISTLGTETRRVRLYAFGTVVYDTGAVTLAFAGDWDFHIRVIRTGGTTARVAAKVTTPSASTVTYSDETDLTGLNFTVTNVLKITGQAGGVGGAANDIVAKFGKGIWYPAA